MLRKNILMAVMLLALFSSGIAAQGERLQVVASFSILADVVSNVTGDAATVTSLIHIGADPHSYSPSPRDIAAVANADVVFINGIHFEENLIETIENAGGDPNIVVVSTCVRILPAGVTAHDHEEEGEHKEETVSVNKNIDPSNAERCAAHDAELANLHSGTERNLSKVEPIGALYAVECDDAAADDEHEHGACDPHVWTDPHNVIYWTLLIRDTLVELDPANADIYQANAAAYIEQLEALIHDFIEPMMASVPEDKQILVTNHETLGYLAAAYGYEIVGTVLPGASTAAEPSAANVAALINLIKREGVTAVFAENTVNANIARQVAVESGANFYTLLSDSLSTADGQGATYIDYMRYNVATIVEALGGGI